MRAQEPREFKRQMKGLFISSAFVLIGLTTAMLLYGSSGFARFVGSDFQTDKHLAGSWIAGIGLDLLLTFIWFWRLRRKASNSGI
jgi:hypothetical protein